MSRRISRKRLPSGPDQIRTAMEQMYAERQEQWHAELLVPPIDWTALLGLHLQMIELENMLAMISEQKEDNS